MSIGDKNLQINDPRLKASSVTSSGASVKYRMMIGTDVLDAADRRCIDIALKYRRSIFFTASWSFDVRNGITGSFTVKPQMDFDEACIPSVSIQRFFQFAYMLGDRSQNPLTPRS